MSEPFSVREEQGAYVLVDRASHAEARIAPAEGNNVTSFCAAPPGSTAPVAVFVPPDPQSGLGASGYSAGNPILFPFPNRVQGGRYTFDGRELQLEINEVARGNHIHGLVSKLPWRTEDAGAAVEAGAWHRAAITLNEHPDVARQYPFSCRLTVTTRLRQGVLSQEIQVRNTGAQRLPMGYGTHPWFSASLGTGPRADTQVRVPANKYWQLDQLLPTGTTIPVGQPADPPPSASRNRQTGLSNGSTTGKYDLRRWRALDGHEFDDVFTDLIRRPDGWSEAGIRYANAGWELIVEASPEFREWVLFAPAARPVICLEPYTGTTNAVNLSPRGVDAGLIALNPGAMWSATIRTLLREVSPK